jgi:hypothetical protein
MIFVGHILDFLDQFFEGDLIRFCHIFERAELLHKTADALCFILQKNGKGARRLLQNLLNSQLSGESICVHLHK